MTSAAPASLVAGLLLGLSLIVAIGAQNAFVLQQGISGRHVVPVVVTCMLSDAVLIVAGTAGAGVLLRSVPAAVQAVRVAGALFLLGYGMLAARRAWRPAGGLEPDAVDGPAGRGGGGSRRSLRGALLACLAFTWLNPHVYLDTVVLLGSVAAGRGGTRWWFALGACLASLLWFAGLGLGAAALRPVFARPTAWRVLDAFIAATMGVLGISLLTGA